MKKKKENNTCLLAKGAKKEYLSKMHCKSNGITLIALVVTIVVLLILAGVSITVLWGDNRNYQNSPGCSR